MPDTPADTMRAILAIRAAFPGTVVISEVYATPFSDEDDDALVEPDS